MTERKVRSAAEVRALAEKRWNEGKERGYILSAALGVDPERVFNEIEKQKYMLAFTIGYSECLRDVIGETYDLQFQDMTKDL